MLNSLLNSLSDNIKNFKRFYLSVAEGVIKNPQNKTYNTTCIESLKNAVQHDHTEVEFRGNECSNEILYTRDCVIPDVRGYNEI